MPERDMNKKVQDNLDYKFEIEDKQRMAIINNPNLDAYEKRMLLQGINPYAEGMPTITKEGENIIIKENPEVEKKIMSGE